MKVYAKLPGWFKVPTPLGTYNPDWAVLVEKDGAERLYFVVETKSSLFTDDLRDKEGAKIECGEGPLQGAGRRREPGALRQGHEVRGSPRVRVSHRASHSGNHQTPFRDRSSQA